MVGANFTGNVSHVAEANFFNDPEAARIVLRSVLESTKIGLDVAHKVFWEEKDLQPLVDTRNERADFLLHIILFISNAYEKLTGWRRCVQHDPLAAAVCLYPNLVKSEKCYVDVKLKVELTRGVTVDDRRVITQLGEGNINLTLEVDKKNIKTV